MDCGRRLGGKHAHAGFTLLEMMIVISIILILASVSSVRYQQVVLQAREVALKQDLRLIRQSIEQYTLEQQERPQSLDELVSAGYLGEIPVDPFTRRKDWRVVTAEVALQVGRTSGGITDAHSNSDAISSSGMPYSSW
jgi:general secretion pathway protein G